MMIAEHGHAVADELSADPIMRREPLARTDAYISDLPARRDPQIRRAPSGTGLYDVLDLILDKGIVIDAFVRVSLVGIELLAVDLRVVIASVDTYLRYAEGVERLGVYKASNPAKLSDIAKGGMSGMAMKSGASKISKALTGGEEGEEGDGDEGSGQDEGVVGQLAQGVRNVMRRGVRGIVGRLSGEEGGEGEESDADHAHEGRPHGARHHIDRSEGSGGNGRHARDGGSSGSGRAAPKRSGAGRR